MSSPEDARTEATRRGHTMGPWRSIVGEENGITSCVCACGAWVLDLGGGRVDGSATRYTCTPAPEVGPDLENDTWQTKAHLDDIFGPGREP